MDYLTVASILAGFSVQVLVFRISREVNFPVGTRRLPWPDYLVVATVCVCLLLVVLPSVALTHSSFSIWLSAVAAASCAATTILVTAYPFAILSHYDVLTSPATQGANQRLAKVLTVAAGVLAVVVFIAVLAVRDPRTIK